MVRFWGGLKCLIVEKERERDGISCCCCCCCWGYMCPDGVDTRGYGRVVVEMPRKACWYGVGCCGKEKHGERPLVKEGLLRGHDKKDPCF